VITKEEFVEWKRDRVTKYVFGLIENKIAELKDRLVNEVAYDSVGKEATAGAIKAYEQFLDIDYEESE
jgi:hypothetical protein